MRFELQGDGVVCLRDGDTVVYRETRGQFELDAGAGIQLPEGMASLAYDADARVLVFFDAKGNAYPVEGEKGHELGDLAIATAADLVRRKVARDNPVLTVEQQRAHALLAIDTKAGAVRGRYITTVPGQEATYLLKERQAESFKAAGYVGTVPGMVGAEVTATKVSSRQACDAILAERDFWVLKASAIESARRSGKVAVGEAADAAAVAEILAGTLAALDVL